VSSSSSIVSDAVSDALIGVTIGSRYRVEHLLGRGGMGVVYAGVQEGLERKVAIKVLRPGYADDVDAIERMFREARSASQMGHPNICDVYDLGRLPDGRPYMVMPLLHGADLTTLIEQEAPMSVARVAELLRGPAAALDVMHARDIVHRDIKPENLFREIHADGSEVIKLVDFGLATMLFTDNRLTREGLVCGTPHYIAPEAGDGTLPDARGDVYSLAVVAFEMLTGRLPFDGDIPMAIVTQKMVQPPPRLADVSDESFDDAVEAVLRRGLATDPTERPLRAGQFVQALSEAAGEARALGASDTGPRGGALAFESTVVAEDTEDAPRLPRSRGSLVAVAIFLVIAAVTTGIVGWVATDSGAPAVGREGADTTQPQPEVSESSPADLVTEQTGVPAGPDEPLESDAAAHPSAEPEAARPSAERESVAPSPSPRRRRSRTMASAEQPVPSSPAAGDEPVAHGARVGSTPLPESPGPDRERAEAEARLGTDALLRGRLAEAVRHLRTALQADPRHAPAWRSLGLARQRLGQPTEAISAYRRYLALAPNAPDAPSIRSRIDRLSER
jgi:serine/threonine-protein kinase